MLLFHFKKYKTVGLDHRENTLLLHTTMFISVPNTHSVQDCLQFNIQETVKIISSDLFYKLGCIISVIPASSQVACL